MMTPKQLKHLTQSRDPDDMDLVFDVSRSFVRRRWPNRELIEVDLCLDNGKAIRLPVPDAVCAELQRTRLPRALGVSGFKPEGAISHSPDFRSLHWLGTDYLLTEKQSQVVKALWEAREKGSPDVSQDFLLRACDSDGVRLVDLFRRSPAWGTIIISRRRGTYRLPDSPAE